MKEKTSITLSQEVLAGIDDMAAGSEQSRSAFIEEALRQYLRDRKKAERRAHDLAILHRDADDLNRQAEDGLEDQASED